jgi:hypothetical protein
VIVAGRKCYIFKMEIDCSGFTASKLLLVPNESPDVYFFIFLRNCETNITLDSTTRNDMANI